MLLAVSIFPFLCALFLFAYFFDRYAGNQETGEITETMQQMNRAKVIPFPEPQPEKPKSIAAGA